MFGQGLCTFWAWLMAYGIYRHVYQRVVDEQQIDGEDDEDNMWFSTFKMKTHLVENQVIERNCQELQKTGYSNGCEG